MDELEKVHELCDELGAPKGMSADDRVALIITRLACGKASFSSGSSCFSTLDTGASGGPSSTDSTPLSGPSGTGGSTKRLDRRTLGAWFAQLVRARILGP